MTPKKFNEPSEVVSGFDDKASTEAPPKKQSKRSFLELWQLKILIEFFDKTSQSPTSEEIKKLSQKVKRKEDIVWRWFYYRRKNVNSDKVRKKVMNYYQMKTLEKFFDRNQNPSVEEMEKLSEDLELSVIKVNKWFYHRRYKANKESKNNSLVSKEKKKINRRNANYTDEEKKALEAEYKKNKHPSSEEKKKISEKLGLDVLRVHFWFQSRRSNRYSSKDDGSSHTGPGPSSSLMMNKYPLNLLNKDTATRTELSKSNRQTLNRSEESSLQSNYENKQSCNVSNESFDFNNLTEETPTSSFLNDYNKEDLDNLIGETSLFPELFE